MIYFCSQKNRRAAVLRSATLNGIDYLEVLGPAGCGTQLAVTFLKDARLLALASANIVINGGTVVQVSSVSPATADAPLIVTVDLDATGDFSPYTLTLVAGSSGSGPPDGIDPPLSSVDFSFKAGCPTVADCLPSNCCPLPVSPVPDINYLAKDFEGFRQIMLDRMAVLVPAWTETHAADMGMAMVEALAYVADRLSYQQDAISTEAYLGTARSRISLRRHARLVDYRIGEGSNAHAWVFLKAMTDQVDVPAGSLFYTRVPGLPPAAISGDAVAAPLAKSTQPVFTAMRGTRLFTEQNQMDFYTWGDAGCCLPPGATTATLVGNLTTLGCGTVLIFEEVLGPGTGSADAADPSHRCAVRLTSVAYGDSNNNPLTDPLTGESITQVEWSDADALPFALCLSSTIVDPVTGSRLVSNISVARGNVLPADHGICVGPESLGTVPSAPPAPDSTTGCACNASSPVAVPRPRYFPHLSQSPLTFSSGYDEKAPATAFLTSDPSGARPCIAVSSDDGGIWAFESDLLETDGTERAFVTEIERDGTAYLRFGDGQYGMQADAGLSFTASYRVGNGSAGNVGRDSLAHVVLPKGSPVSLASIGAVRNPLAASGGVDPEDMEHVRQSAPFAFQSQVRCVTEADYGQMAAQLPDIREARGTLRWTGSWYTAFVSIDPVTAFTNQLIAQTTQTLNLLRMMGTDLAVEGAVIVGLRIEMQICVDPGHFRGDVYAALMQVFVTGDQCTGSSGLLNPVNFSFGETVYASPFIAAAQAVDGVVSVTLSAFGPVDDPSVDGVALGYLTMGRLQIPRCDNDPDHLDRGVFVLHMDGGK